MFFKEKVLEVKNIDIDKAKQLALEIGVSSLVTSVLLARGIDNVVASLRNSTY